MKSVVFTAAAEADVTEAFAWYDDQRSGLGEAFNRALDIAVAFVASNPEAHGIVHRNTRRILLPKFPYGLYYRQVGEVVLVIACTHAKRHSRTWRSRLPR